MSLFARLMVLVVIAVSPVVGLEIYHEIELRNAKKNEIIRETKILLHRIEEQQTYLIDGVRQVIATLAQTNSVRQKYAPLCQNLMERLRPQYPSHIEILITNQDGTVTCATEKSAVGTSVAGSAPFRQVRAGKGFAAGAPVLDGRSGKVSLPFAIPYRDTDDGPAGAIIAFLDIDWLRTYLAERSMPEGTSLIVADRQGIVLLRIPDRPDTTRGPLPGQLLGLLGAGREGVVETTGLDGRERIIVYSPPAAGTSDMFFAIGIDSRQVKARMGVTLIQSWFLTALVTAMLAAVWFGGRVFVVTPVNALLDATRRWQKGDRTARVRFSDHASEIGMLGQAFDEMADGLEAEIGRRERAHEAVQAAEARLRTIFDTAVDAMVVVDRNGVVNSFNPAAERIFGYDAAEVTGRSVSMLIPWPGWKELVAGTQREAEGRRKGGQTFPLELSIGTWFLDGREYFTGIVRDVSARKRAEDEREALRAALDAERALLQAVVRYMSTGLLVVEAPSGRLVFHNEEAERLLGQPLHLDALSELDRHVARQPDGSPLPWADYPIARAVLTGETVLQEEVSYQRGDGSIAVLSVNATPVHDEAGAVALVVCTFHDISTRRIMERALRKSEEKLSIALSSARAGTWDWDIETGRATWSEQTYRLLGVRTSKPITQDDWFGAIHPDDRPRVLEDVRSGLERRQASYHAEFRIVHPRKGERWVEAIGRAAYAADGRPLKLSGISLDVTGRKRMEGELQQAKAVAEEASLAKTKFLAAASHDLRQPIQSMLLFTSSLVQHVRDEAGAEKLRNLERSMDALKDLLDSLLDVSRLDAGQVAPQIRDFPLGSLLDEISSVYGAVAASRNLEWQVETCDQIVRSDRNLLGRMVRNLVENALRYTPAGFVRIECREVGGQARIEIRDSGIGIPDDHTERIWHEFHQVGNPERDREQGLGLGLAIVRRLANLLGHRTDMRSVQGSGSVFSIDVPLGMTEAGPGSGAEAPDPLSDGGGRLALVVDDDAMVLAALEATLLDWGYEVVTAGTLDEAAGMISSGARPPDIVIADYRLRHGVTGTEVIRRIRELAGSRIPAILLTGEAGEECRQDAERFGFDLVHKPVTPHRLAGVLDKQFGLP